MKGGVPSSFVVPSTSTQTTDAEDLHPSARHRIAEERSSEGRLAIAGGKGRIPPPPRSGALPRLERWSTFRPCRPGSKPSEAGESVTGPASSVIAPPSIPAPRVVASREEILRAPLRPLEHFLIGFVNGKRSIEQISRRMGWTREEVEEAIDRLLGLGIVER